MHVKNVMCSSLVFSGEIFLPFSSFSSLDRCYPWKEFQRVSYAYWVSVRLDHMLSVVEEKMGTVGPSQRKLYNCCCCLMDEYKRKRGNLHEDEVAMNTEFNCRTLFEGR